MQLSHTCHDHGHHQLLWGCVTPKVSLKEEEILNIQFTEKKDIALYKDLLQQFEDAWTTHDGILLDFIDDYWTSRMKKVLKEMDGASDVEEIQRLGVTIYTCKPPPRQKKLPLPFKNASSKWFQWRVGTILDGTYTEFDKCKYVCEDDDIGDDDTEDDG
jgi:hypothetical protein